MCNFYISNKYNSYFEEDIFNLDDNELEYKRKEFTENIQTLKKLLNSFDIVTSWNGKNALKCIRTDIENTLNKWEKLLENISYGLYDSED